MEGLKELCRELLEKRGKNQNQIAKELKIPVLTLKSYLYKGARPKDKRVETKIKRYFERELSKTLSVEEKPKVPKKGIRKRLEELTLEIGNGNERAGINTIKRGIGASNSSFNNWYYQGLIPKKNTLEKLASYLTTEVGRKITPEYLLEIEKEPEPKPIETPKPKKVVKPKVSKPEKKEEKLTKKSLIEMAEALALKIKEYEEEEKGIILSEEEMKLVNKFRQLSDEAKKGLILFLK